MDKIVRTEEIRQRRREYQQKYRKGLIPAREHKIIDRKSDQGNTEHRKLFSYYLDKQLAINLRNYCKISHKKRRDVVATALNAYIEHNNYESDQIRSVDRIFQYDELSALIVEHVNFVIQNQEKKILKCDFAAQAIYEYLLTV